MERHEIAGLPGWYSEMDYKLIDNAVDGGLDAIQVLKYVGDTGQYLVFALGFHQKHLTHATHIYDRDLRAWDAVS